ncbi:MAG: family 16 glycosylhydrolase [Bacteroidota bacterium]|jgi:beta-glucanase (GH16 family)
MTTKYIFLFISLILYSCKKGGTDCCLPPVETQPTISIDAISLAEGNTGLTDFNFTIKLSKASSKAVTVKVNTKNGTAISPNDFTSLEKTITIAPGETSAKVAVAVVADEFKEADEDFQLMLFEPTNASIETAIGAAFIMNDDSKFEVNEKGYTTPNSYAGMNLVWADEFNGTSLNTDNWNYDVGDGCPNCGWGNNELQFYTAGDNLYFQSGKMIIEARKENKNGKSYTSTRLTSMNKRSFKFGRVDFRAKIPSGQGIWPAFWMLGDNFPTAGWPACGEIDIMEVLGQQPSKIYSTIHFKSGNTSARVEKSLLTASSLADEFHVYSLVWEKDKIKTMVDDKTIAEFDPSQVSAPYPFNEKFFFIMNIAVGGNWPGSPNATTYFPQFMMVDYIRVFQ